MKLYELTNEVRALDDLYMSCVDEETGEIMDSETLEELETMLQTQIKEKAGNLIKFFIINDDYIETIDKEIKRLTGLKKRIENKKETFKKYVKNNMEQMGIKKIETELGNFSLRASKSVNIYDESLIDDRFITQEIKYKISKTDIKKAIEKGEQVNGAVIESKNSLIIK